IHSQQIEVGLAVYAIGLAYGYSDPAARSLLVVSSPCAVDQYVAHDCRAQTVELSPILKTNLVLLHKPAIRVVNQRRWLKSARVRFATKITRGQPPQLGVNQRNQFIARAAIAVAPPDQQLSDPRSLVIFFLDQHCRTQNRIKKAM